MILGGIKGTRARLGSGTLLLGLGGLVKKEVAMRLQARLVAEGAGRAASAWLGWASDGHHTWHTQTVPHCSRGKPASAFVKFTLWGLNHSVIHFPNAEFCTPKPHTSIGRHF